MKAFAAACTGVFVLVSLACSDDTESSTSAGGAGGAGGSTAGQAGSVGSGGSSSGSGGAGGSAGRGGSGGSSSSSGGAGGSTAAGSGGTGTGGGGSADACNTCAQMQFNGPGSACWDDLQGCLLDATCNDWFNCAQGCQGADFVASCFAACDADAAAAAEVFQPVADCLCASCADDCAPRCN